MKVLLIGNYLPDGQTSMQAFKRVLERELPRLGCELRVLTPAQHALRVSRASRLWKWLGYVDKFVLFRPALAAALRWADVVHICDHSNAMYVPWVQRKANLVTCHDVIAVEASLGMVEGWQVGWSGRLFQRLIARGLGKAELVACVSHLTQRALLALHIVDSQRITTVLNGLNDDFTPVAPDEGARLIARFGLSPQDRFLIHVGMDLPRKNRRTVVQAFLALQQRAAASGTPAVVQRLLFVGPSLEPSLAELVQQHGIADRIDTVKNVSHEELRALYASATALLFPSLQEGFGWPVIEAQACGCPVFTSDLAPMNEIGGPGAVYIDPKNPAAIAEAIERAAPRLPEMRRLGLENAAGYTAAQMASNYVAIYRRLVDARKDGR
ncbi:D-inositol 3-phosphate glycosyltransferase [Variovorax sp. SRS16]|uniref:glycosyltransferase family 4 protein n=1 Tax=Variovorax sp. SRS16 TaxID=282217 RepID=UPI001317F2B1|nr:glycosyltransferase family 1 protein [Variovorax sp. SRS16]VTU26032.1 D-inositol 3-phosphate glycosyltransferase [Variovorax sp. SRS16]